MTIAEKQIASDPTTLVAIARAAHQNGDRDLERTARRELEQRHGIAIRFIQKPKVASHV